jgi:hypothetical protein
MIYNINIVLDIDPASSMIPADENEEYLVDLFTDLLYDLSDIQVQTIEVERLSK